MGILTMLSPGVRACVAKATTFEDQLEAFWRRHNHVPNSATQMQHRKGGGHNKKES